VPWLYLIVVLAVAADRQRKCGWLVTNAAPWGSLTYSRYMLHTPLHAIVFSGLIDHKLHLDGAARNVGVGISVVALVAISYLSLELFEKPLRDRIGGLPQFGQPQTARAPAKAAT
jgi:peptidoglycan/LPS O-acetylase OafA/YrhL